MKIILAVAIQSILLFHTLSLYAASNIELNESEKEYLKQHNVLTYISDPNWLPYEGYDSEYKHIGIIPEIIKIIENNLDTEINLRIKTLKSDSWEETLEKSNQKKVDILTSDPQDPSLQKKFKHTDIYLKNPIVIVMTNNNKYVPQLKYIENKKIAIVQNYGYVKKLKEVYPQIDFKYVKSLDEGLFGVANKKYDAFLASATAATYNISKNGLNNLSIVGSTAVEMNISFFVNRDDTVLLSILNKSISKLKPEDVITVMNKWSVVKFTQKIDYKLITKIVVFFLGLLIIVFIWNHQLKKSKNKIDELNQQLSEKINELEVLSITDAMTGLYNRRYFEKIFSEELNRAKRNNYKLIFAMLDVDHFKQYNDTYGHGKGDKVLISISKIMQESTQRAHEFAFRIGGEEFCIITSDIDNEIASSYINRLRIAILDSKIEHTGNSASKYVTASFGLVIVNCENTKDLTTDSIYKTADDALYRAKEAGRNKVELVSI